MPYSFSDLLADYFYEVCGCLRKRAKHRCKKRGEDFEQYEARIKDKQRAIGKPIFEAQIKAQLQKPSLLSLIPKDAAWTGGYIPVPFGYQSRRKRAKYRNRSK